MGLQIRSNPGQRRNGVLELHNPIQGKGWGEEKGKRRKGGREREKWEGK